MESIGPSTTSSSSTSTTTTTQVNEQLKIERLQEEVRQSWLEIVELKYENKWLRAVAFLLAVWVVGRALVIYFWG